MTLPSPAEYRRAADAMRADARCFQAIADGMQPQEHHLTFGPPLVQHMRQHYLAMSEVTLLAADQADELAADLDAMEAVA